MMPNGGNTAVCQYLGSGSTTTRKIDFGACCGGRRGRHRRLGTGPLSIGGATVTAGANAVTLKLLGSNTGTKQCERRH